MVEIGRNNVIQRSFVIINALRLCQYIESSRMPFPGVKPPSTGWSSSESTTALDLTLSNGSTTIQSTPPKDGNVRRPPPDGDQKEPYYYTTVTGVSSYSSIQTEFFTTTQPGSMSSTEQIIEPIACYICQGSGNECGQRSVIDKSNLCSAGETCWTTVTLVNSTIQGYSRSCSSQPCTLEYSNYYCTDGGNFTTECNKCCETTLCNFDAYQSSLASKIYNSVELTLCSMLVVFFIANKVQSGYHINGA